MKDKDWATGINCGLAEDCATANAACCKKGKLFLTLEEKKAIEDWLASNSPSEFDSFQSRLTSFEGFFLYDQQERCQFLNDRNLCRLHEDGSKPTECFAWPLHIYVDRDQNLELRAGTSCCEAYLRLVRSSKETSDIRPLFAKYSPALLRAFRREYPGSYETKFIRKIDDAELD